MTRHHMLLWIPRVLGIAVSAFLGLFALDAFQPDTPFARAIMDFTLHLAPAAVVLGLVIVSVRRPWIGGVAFLLLAVAYAISVRSRLDWILTISGPLLTVGLLFLWSSRDHRLRQG